MARCGRCQVICQADELEKDEYIGPHRTNIMDDAGQIIDYEYSMRRYEYTSKRDRRRLLCKLCRLENAGMTMRGTYGTQMKGVQ